METTLRSGSYNYRFDWLALTAMGFSVTDDLSQADVIVGSRALSDEAIGAVKGGIPYMGYSSGAVSSKSALMQELGVALSNCKMGTDFLGHVEYPSSTLINSTYINEGDDVMYEYGTYWFTQIPEGATVLVKNAGKTPLQGCICLTDDASTAQFGEYNSGVVGFEYQSCNLDIALFANVLNHKIHQTDEYTFISSFIFSRTLSDVAYEGVAVPSTPDTPETPDTPNPAKSATGDTMNVTLWVVVAIASCAAIPAVVVVCRRRTSR